MAFDLKTATPDTSFPANGFLFGADSQSATDPSIYSHTAYLNYILSLANTWAATQTITPAANANALAVTGYSLTGANAQSIIDLSGTWNTSGTPSAIKLNVTDTASNASSLLVQLQVGGSNVFTVNKSGGTTLQSGAAYSISEDVFLYRDAANVFAQRNSTNAQTVRIYGTYTDASNYERIALGYDTGNGRYFLQTQKAGSGATRDLYFQGGTASGFVYSRSGGNILEFGQDGVGTYWRITSAGAFVAATDNAYDIGAVGATRPRNLFLGSYMSMTEMTAPSAPATNSVRVYAEDNGSGKTRLMALFATGAAQQIAIEP